MLIHPAFQIRSGNNATFSHSHLSSFVKLKYMPGKTVCIVATLVVVLTFIACDPCKNLDCVSDSYGGQFRIVSKTDGKDLVFGPNAIYDKKKIKFYSLKGTDTVFFQYEPIKFPGSGYDSILSVWFYPQIAAPAYIKLDNTDTDTLVLSYNTYNTKCCGTITEIINFRYNNSTDIPGNKGTQELRK